MDEKLDLIVLQNWILIGVLFAVLALSVACGIMNLRNTRTSNQEREDPRRAKFAELWEADEIDVLLRETEIHLSKYKNSVDALYFRAKAFRRVSRGAEAKTLFERLIAIEPSMRKSIEPLIRDIDGDQA